VQRPGCPRRRHAELLAQLAQATVVDRKPPRCCPARPTPASQPVPALPERGQPDQLPPGAFRGGQLRCAPRAAPRSRRSSRARWCTISSSRLKPVSAHPPGCRAGNPRRAPVTTRSTPHPTDRPHCSMANGRLGRGNASRAASRSTQVSGGRSGSGPRAGAHRHTGVAWTTTRDPRRPRAGWSSGHTPRPAPPSTREWRWTTRNANARGPEGRASCCPGARRRPRRAHRRTPAPAPTCFPQGFARCSD